MTLLEHIEPPVIPDDSPNRPPPMPPSPAPDVFPVRDPGLPEHPDPVSEPPTHQPPVLSSPPLHVDSDCRQGLRAW